MARAELIAKKAKIDEQLGKVTIAINAARRELASGGRRLPREQFIALEIKEANLKSQSQKLQAELSAINVKNRTKINGRIEFHFVNAASEVLDDATFSKLLSIAKSRALLDVSQMEESA